MNAPAPPDSPSAVLGDVQALRSVYAAPGERAQKKQLAALDPHARRFIELSPFLVLATCGAEGTLDASPRGGAPGFVKTPDAHTLLIPDAPGNNRLDSFSNIVATGEVGLLFMIPGFDETLRVNGSAVLSRDAADVALCTYEPPGRSQGEYRSAQREGVSIQRRAPKAVVRVSVREVYLHCAKAFMRSRLWHADSLVARETMPTLGQMIGDQTGIQSPPETPDEMRRRYEPDL